MTRESSRAPAGQTVLTTGANSGIGLATVLELARRGFRSVGSVRSEEKARALERAAAEAGVEVGTVLLDVTDASRCARVIDELRPWGLVNNAGYSLNGAVEDVSDEEARHLLETMVLAPMRLARLALAHMRDAGGGRIVNVSSIYGRTTTPLTGWYQGAKHALEAVSDALRVEVAGDGIGVILIEPGASAPASGAKPSTPPRAGAFALRRRLPSFADRHAPVAAVDGRPGERCDGDREGAHRLVSARPLSRRVRRAPHFARRSNDADGSPRPDRRLTLGL